MPDTPSVTSIKRFNWRGSLEEWSNTYHFSGTTPANAAGWKTLTDAIAAAEKLALYSNHSIVRFYGYEAGNELSVYQRDMTITPDAVVAGSIAPGANVLMPGDVAITWRWLTPNFTSRGKRIYGRKYWHSASSEGIGIMDNVNPAQRTLLGTLAAKLIDGTLPGSFKVCGPQGAVYSDPFVAPYLTTRTLKRRGKRPPTA